MKLSVSLREVDVMVLDRYMEYSGVRSRSAAVQRAIALLRHAELADEYESAFAEWEQSDDRGLWEPVVADGLGHAAG